MRERNLRHFLLSLLRAATRSVHYRITTLQVYEQETVPYVCHLICVHTPTHQTTLSEVALSSTVKTELYCDRFRHTLLHTVMSCKSTVPITYVLYENTQQTTTGHIIRHGHRLIVLVATSVPTCHCCPKQASQDNSILNSHYS